MSFSVEPSFDTVTLERMKVAGRKHIGAFTMHSLELSRFQNDLADELIYALTAEVLAEKLPPASETSTTIVRFDVPATWFQHLKQSLYGWRRKSFRTRGLRFWLERRFPVRYETLTRRVTLTVSLERYRTYPKANIVLPPDRFGQPVRVAITRTDWLHDSL